MKKLKNIGKTLVLFSLALGFFACNDDDDGSAPFDIIGDVIVIKKLVDDESVYANSYIAYGNQPMSLAQVTTPSGEEIMLSPAGADQYTYAQSPGFDDYVPVEEIEMGNYMFDVINEDIPHQDVDLLVFEDIDYTTITLFETEVDMLTVEWDQNSMADAYMLRLVDDAGSVIFMSQLLGTQVERFVIDPNDPQGTWAQSPIAGQDYTFELLAYLFEEDATDSDYSFNVQEISITEEMVTWQ